MSDVTKKSQYSSNDRRVVKSGGKERASDFRESEARAVTAAEAAVQVEGGEFRVQRHGGRSRGGYVIGRGPFTKISAIEGIAPTPEAKNRAREFDRKGLSPEERRRAIIKAYQANG